MKKCIGFLMIAFISVCTLQAQNWQLFQGDTIHYLKKENYSFGFNNQSSTFGLTVLIDTVINRTNSIITVFKKDFSDSESLDRFNSNSCTSLSACLFGDSLIVDADTSTFYVDSSNIYWLPKGNSWIFYSDT